MNKNNTQRRSRYRWLLTLFFAGLHGLAFGQWQQLFAPKSLSVHVQKYQGAYLNLSADGLYRSQDKGATWERHPALLTGTDGFTINPYNNKWYKVAAGIYESVDEGLNWTNLNAPNNVTGVQFSRDTVFIKVNNHDFLKRVGGNWQYLLQNTGDEISSFCIKDSVIFLGYYSNGLFRSKNYGQTWQQVFWVNNEYCDVTAKGDTLFCFFPSPNRVYRSYDFGVNWESANLPNDIKFSRLTIGDGMILGSLGGLFQPYYSFDGLNNWKALNFPAGITAGEDVFQDGNLMLMSTNFGAFRSFDLGETWEASNNVTGLTPGYDLSYIDGNVMTGCFSYLKEGDNQWKTPLPIQCRSLMVKWNNLYLSGLTTSNASVGLGLWQITPTTFPYFNPNIINGTLTCECSDFVHQSSDNGATWQPTIVKRPTFSHLPIVGVGNTLWAAGSAQDVAVFRYDTLGQNWPHDALWTIGSNCSFLNFRDTLYLLTQAGPVQYSPDGGHSVVTTNQPADFVSSGAVGRSLFVRDNFMVITTLQENFYVSKDRGQSWVKLPSPPAGTNFYSNTPTVGEHFIYTSTDKSLFAYPLDSIQFNRGQVFLDENSNGLREPNEPGIANIKVGNTGSGQITFSGKQGDFGLTGYKAQDSLRVLSIPAGFAVQPASAVFQDVQHPVLFGLQPTANINDLAINLTNAKPFRPGFETVLSGWVKNLGTISADATISIALPPDLEIISIQPSNATVAGNNITWALHQFSPLDVYDFQVVVKTSALTPAGTLINIFANVPYAADIHPADNGYTLQETVISSFDPNDKVVFPEKISPPELTDAPLTYTIRFQNTGTAPTEFVLIQDSISPQLDINSLQLVASSHPVQVQFKAGRLVEFVFAPLALVPEIESESGSQGFVRFSIKAIPGLAVGDVIDNKAYIYFDFNQPIITNTAGTEIKAVHTQSPESQRIEIAPNPAGHLAVLKVPVSASVPGTLYLYRQNGQQAFQQNTSRNEAVIPCQSLTAGAYTVQWKIGRQVFAGKLVVEH